MKIVEDLIATRDKTLSFYDLPETKMYLTYRPDSWCVKEILHHLADAETVLYERLKRPLAEPAPVMWVFAQDEWCKKLDYRNTPLEINRAVFTAVRNAIISMAPRFYESHGHLIFNHSRMGIRTIKEEFEKVVWHNQNHLDQIEQCLRMDQK